MENPSFMKKWLLLIPASLVVLACHTSPSTRQESAANALPVSAVDTPPPVQMWEEDPDYQEDHAGGNPAPPMYDSLGRRIVPPKGVGPNQGTGKTPGKGSDPSQTIDPKILEQDRLRNIERMRIHDSIQKANEKPVNDGK